MQRIKLAHGSGGAATQELVSNVFEKYLLPFLQGFGEDGGIFDVRADRLAVSTDSYVVSPLFFSGGDIGKLSICGSCNDVAMMGARPRFLTLGFILEEGLEIEVLQRVLESMAQEIERNNLKILSADTKVVGKGSVDKIFINSTAIGEVIKPCSINNLADGDAIILSSPIGAHGGVIFCARNEIDLKSDLKSDCRSLFCFLDSLLHSDVRLHTLRDATRGGLAAVLNEWASSVDCDILIQEDAVKIPKEVGGICEILGLEAYSLANEGAFVLSLPKSEAKRALELLHEAGLSDASIIGEIRPKSGNLARVILENSWGSARFLDNPVGELLPRIC